MEEEQQFIDLYDKYAEPIYRYIHYKTYNREISEDLTSQTFLKALEKKHQFNSSKGTISSWLYGIARNLVTDYFRSAGRWGLIGGVSDIWDLPAEDDAVREMMNRETVQEVHSAMNLLNARQREIVILRIWEEMPYREISAVTGESEANCKMHFSRALKKLKSSLETALLFELIIAPFSEGVMYE